MLGWAYVITEISLGRLLTQNSLGIRLQASVFKDFLSLTTLLLPIS